MASLRQDSSERGGKNLHVALLSDGIAGHFRQSEGVVAALERRHAVKLHRIELPKRAGPVRWLLGLAARLMPARLPLSWYLGSTVRDLPLLDVIVSSGGRTLAANTVLGRHHDRACNIFSGSPRQFGRDAFSLVLLSYPARPEKGVYVLKPTALDPDHLPPPRRRDETNPYRIALLIGGPTASCELDDAAWQKIVAMIRTLGRTPGVSLLPVTSRRTPIAWCDELLTLAPNVSGIERVIDFRTAGPGSIAAAFETDALMVTADSMSMITEGVAARRPVAILEPAKTHPSRDDATVDDLEGRRRIARIRLADEITGETILAALDACQPMTDNHLDALSAVIERVLPER
jgi:mitochondrial fission protein ELM1